MTNKKTELLIGNVPFLWENKAVEGKYLQLFEERYYRIANYDLMPPFFMSLVSSTDHWLFISSNGGLTAGRINADSALFPYETEDKITAHSEQTGSKTLLHSNRNSTTHLWEPFSERYAGVYKIQRNLYKNIYGNKLIFEEINHDLQLTIRTGWSTGDRFGFIKSCWLINHGDSDCRIELLDGLQNLLPYGATIALQTSLSSLMNAYKRNELDTKTGLAIYALSATLSDRAEPSESLKATVAWQVGLDSSGYLLCGDQIDAFRAGRTVRPEQDVLGKAGAFFANATLELPPGQSRQWHIVADVNQDGAALVRLKNWLQLNRDTINKTVEEDISLSTAKLVNYVAAADGLQLSSQEMTTTHHFANVLFNVMRGGIFAGGYQIDRNDLLDFIAVRYRPLLRRQADWFEDLSELFSIQDLRARAAENADPDLIRLCNEYLPLSFSRRHGDPSRPWNIFSINLKQLDGSPRLDYQGNWRDIFQNWEPLAHSFPYFIEGMIAKFLNAMTVDGYNPYRITRDGIEWEVPEPENPWSNIGYWNDHQIIYLQKLLEIIEQFQPEALESVWNQAVFAYANVPYRLRSYSEMLADWNETVDFDWQLETTIEKDVAEMGTDGRLLRDATGAVIHVTMIEKLLVLLLAKLTNLIPEGGIWMNTQRPEWNDANNALAGKGLSVVTAAYLRRFIAFWKTKLIHSESGTFPINTALARLFTEVQRILGAYQDHLESGFTDRARREIMDELGEAITAYRSTVYEEGLPGSQVDLTSQEIVSFLVLAQSYIEQTLRTNLSQGGLTHSYNVLHLHEHEAAVENLYLMLEGQVALMSSGILSPNEVVELLESMRYSDLYRPDLHTYMLYPNRALPGFLEKNNVPADQVTGSELVAALTAAGDKRLLICDEDGVYHFNGDFRNADDVTGTLDELATEAAYEALATAERAFILDLFETTFNHSEFTGRSGTFFAYEGLGSVYWHMVSKLLLAAQESYQQAVDENANPSVVEALADAYYDIRQGLGFNKSPAEYGAFPADPYSHTPMGGGARQPGMTGQVKEEILTRLGELGVSIRRGVLCFRPTLLRRDEYLLEASEFAYVDVGNQPRTVTIQANSLAFTVCQTPIVYVLGDSDKIFVHYNDGRTVTLTGRSLDEATSKHIFDRDGQIGLLKVVVAL